MVANFTAALVYGLDKNHKKKYMVANFTAALAYGLDKNLNGERNLLTSDLGGDNFDVSISTVDSYLRCEIST